ncbi:ferritin-like domain-containing protein [Bisporella sp. PMI_857]|nr:ferritin-like domain-containing protein [Bisporella sp. PMI_857]
MIPIMNTLLLAALSLSTLTHGLPALSGTTMKNVQLAKRQNAAAAAAGLTDVDILQFALTLENLEGAFYSQGFAMFPDQAFAEAGLSQADIANLKSVGSTEQTHVTTLTGAIAAAGFLPVQPCTYNFGFTTPAAMLATAGVLENVGVSAYLGAAPLVTDPAILTVAGEIVTVEARHQTFIRAASKVADIPSAFDTPLGVRSVFSLAAPFISSCPMNSNLQITAFPPVTMTPTPGAAGNGTANMAAGTPLTLTTTATGATMCAFSNGGAPGGTVFVPYTNSQCTVPQGLAGVAYVHLTSSVPAGNILTDNVVVAGVQVIQVS